MLDDGKFCGLDVDYTVEDAGDYVVKLSQEQYEQFVSYRAKGDAGSDVFSVTIDPSKLRQPFSTPELRLNKQTVIISFLMISHDVP